MRLRVFAAIVGISVASVVEAECSPELRDSSMAACLAVELRLADLELNETYEEVLQKVNEDFRKQLRAEQRDWIRKRDELCRLDPRISDQEEWFRDILRDRYKTACTIRNTREREGILRMYVSKPEVASTRQKTAEGATGSNAATRTQPNFPIYDIFGEPARRTGKWYFEAKLKVADMAKSQDAVVFIGVKNELGDNVGTVVNIRPDAQTLGISLYPADKVIGIAADFDNGKVYVRENGEWRKGAPGSSGGTNIMLGRSFRAVVSSSVRVNVFLEQKLMEVNFGERGFVYALPDGYSRFVTQTK